MHPNQAFRPDDMRLNLSFARDRAFGTLCVNGESAPLLAHIPFLLSDDGKCAEMHLVRSNPIARLPGPVDAVISVTGPDGYISPDWYEMEDQVPTWNYVAVHLRGRLVQMHHGTMRDLLERQSAEYEARLDKPAWTIDKMTPEVFEKMLRQIVRFRLDIEAVDGTWKLNQNKPDAARLAAAQEVESSPISHEGPALTKLMRTPPKS